MNPVVFLDVCVRSMSVSNPILTSDFNRWYVFSITPTTADNANEADIPAGRVKIELFSNELPRYVFLQFLIHFSSY